MSSLNRFAPVLASLLALMTPRAVEAQTIEFQRVDPTSFPTSGENALASLTKDDNGDFLGTTTFGGTGGFGTAYKISAAGVYTNLVNFLGPNGTFPTGPLTKGPDGKYYGVTNGGGGNADAGVIYRITSTGAYEKVAQFSGVNAAAPQGRLALGNDGNLYGVAAYGKNSTGVIFKVTPAKVLTILKDLDAVGVNGLISPFSDRRPAAGLVKGTDGSFYGTTTGGGTSGAGVAFKITPGGTYSVIKQFATASLSKPNGLVLGSDGNFYGTTQKGGTNDVGVFFQLTAAGDLTVLASFTAATGIAPYGELIENGALTFYGATCFGGANNMGIVFEATVSGGPTGTITKKADFAQATGARPVVGLTLGAGGDLFGTTPSGGANFQGTVFKVTTGGTITTLTDFGFTDGANLAPGLTPGADGNLYGTATFGGGGSSGTFYRVIPTGAGTVEKIADFQSNQTGVVSFGTLARLGNDFYGTSTSTATNGNGAIFKATMAGVLTKLADFDGTNGIDPNSLTLASDGNFYGTTFGQLDGNGSILKHGTIFRFSEANGIVKLFDFTGAATGSLPRANLVEGPDGALYGTATAGGSKGLGTVFKITTDGEFTLLNSFVGTNGNQPVGPLALGFDGNFYGMTYLGGKPIGGVPFNIGVVYKMTPAGKLNTLTTLTGLTGAFPRGGLVVGPGGDLYGMGYTGGGTNKFGTVFKVSTSGKVSILKTFDGNGTDGVYPSSTLALGSDGNLYGTTFTTVFRLKLTNQAPIANDDTLTLPSIHVNVRKNDSDPDKDPFKITSVTQGAHGAVTIEPDGTLTYLPAVDFTTTDSFTYTITDPLGKTDTATVTVNLPASNLTAGIGAYGGLVTLGGNPRGYWGVGVVLKGVFSGALYLDGVKTSIKGVFDTNGNFQTTINRSGASPLTINLALDAARNQITGTVNDTINTFALTLVRTYPSFSTTLTTPAAGRYTALIPVATGSVGSLTVPQGTGYVSFTVSATGSAKLTGKLADGTPFTAGSKLSHDGAFPLFVQLYGKKGFLVGLVTFSPQTGSDASGLLVWKKPGTTTGPYTAAFETSPTLTAARYTATKPVLALPAPPSNAKLIYDTLGLTKMLSVSTANIVTVTNAAADKTSVKINSTSGIFTGTFMHPTDSLKRSFAGAIYQKGATPRGEGYFAGPTSTQKITLAAP